MKVNRNLFKMIRAWRNFQFYFWLVFYYIRNLPEIIYLMVYIELLHIQYFFVNLFDEDDDY